MQEEKGNHNILYDSALNNTCLSMVDQLTSLSWVYTCGAAWKVFCVGTEGNSEPRAHVCGSKLVSDAADKDQEVAKEALRHRCVAQCKCHGGGPHPRSAYLGSSPNACCLTQLPANTHPENQHMRAQGLGT